MLGDDECAFIITIGISKTCNADYVDGGYRKVEDIHECMLMKSALIIRPS